MQTHRLSNIMFFFNFICRYGFNHWMLKLKNMIGLSCKNKKYIIKFYNKTFIVSNLRFQNKNRTSLSNNQWLTRTSLLSNYWLNRTSLLSHRVRTLLLVNNSPYNNNNRYITNRMKNKKYIIIFLADKYKIYNNFKV